VLGSSFGEYILMRETAERVGSYTRGYILCQGDPFNLHRFSDLYIDTDYDGDVNTTKLMFGYQFMS